MSIKLLSVLVAGLLAGACSAQSEPNTTEAVDTSVADIQATTTTSTSVALAPSTSITQPTDPRVEESAQVAHEFMVAFVGRDMAGIEATSVEGHVFGFLVDQFGLFEQEFAWLDAVGWNMELTECSVENPDIENVRFVCFVNHETAWSRALGVVPYQSEFFLGVSYPGTENWIYPERDTPTVTDRAFLRFPAFFFKSETWTPFLDWLEETHAQDIGTMFGVVSFSEIGLLPGELIPSLSPESVALWEQHTLEFVEANSPAG